MSEALTAEGEVRTFRGSSIEEVLPRIRAELGANAVVLSQKEGLIGGVGGFFQKRCVEVEARAGGAGVDVYDDQDEAVGPQVLSEASSADAMPVRNDAATREGLSTPAVQELVRQAQPFAEMLEGAAADEAPEAEPERSKSAGKLRDGLVGNGLGTGLAGEIVDAVVASWLPFANAGRLRTLVRDELAQRVPVAGAAAPGRRTIAVVGPAGAGKTAAVAGIARAHAGAGKSVACLTVDPSDGGAALESLLAGTGVAVMAVAAKELAGSVGDAGDADLVLIDTPAAFAGAEGLTALGKALKAAGVDETHLALRAGTAATVGAELAEGLAALRPDRLLLTGAAETAHVGGALDVAIRCGLPLAYVAEGPGSIAPADARALASRVTP